MSIKVAVIYYSSTGTIFELAKAASAAAEKAGTEVRLRKVRELAPDVTHRERWAEHAQATQHVVEAAIDDLDWADVIILGSPTRFGLPAAQMKQFIDMTGPLYLQGKLVDKITTSFTASASRHGGQESTILALNNTFYHWGSIIVPPGYVDPIQLRSGNPYGSSHTSNDGKDMPGETEIAAMEFQTRRAIEVADTFIRGRAQL
jgi:NAD(P)H dehydrogenase (quinone)